MKIYQLILALFIPIALMTGCNNTEEQGMELEHEADNDHSIEGNAMDNYNEPANNGQVGYVRFQKDQLDQEEEANHKIKVNREQMADMITRMILRYKEFEDVATLVADDEILIAYQAPENKSRDEAADMVKKTAYSLVPSFYKIYVSDDPASFGDIQSLSNSTVYDEQYSEVVERIVEKMKESPQGTVNSENIKEN
ncbi:YhcN/YlaJ family sporulation lipoprotein [Halobacillus andaensis]|uniref:YhcN/YlaJ family sporulation lipoprotein n=1 Tax=Halobacillus andaensis TaxID=1176239 RepID=UPI003D7108B8